MSLSKATAPRLTGLDLFRWKASLLFVTGILCKGVRGRAKPPAIACRESTDGRPDPCMKAMSDIPAADWDAMACPEASQGPRPLDPFTTHRFLNALDLSGSTGTGTGWQARPLGPAGIGQGWWPPAAVCEIPFSQGEYIFDHGWAEAFERAGGPYYPKLQVAVPFTPVTGRRFPGGRRNTAQALLARRHRSDHGQNGCPACTSPFARRRLRPGPGTANAPPHATVAAVPLGKPGLRQFRRLSGRPVQSQAQDDPQGTRDGARPRADHSRPDRRSDRACEHWAAMWDFYQDTGGRKWGTPYLTPRFFDQMLPARCATMCCWSWPLTGTARSRAR